MARTRLSRMYTRHTTYNTGNMVRVTYIYITVMLTSDTMIQTRLSHHSSTARNTVPRMYPIAQLRTSPKMF